MQQEPPSWRGAIEISQYRFTLHTSPTTIHIKNGHREVNKWQAHRRCGTKVKQKQKSHDILLYACKHKDHFTQWLVNDNGSKSVYDLSGII